MTNFPPRNPDGSYRDERSNTLDDAADFERHFNSHMYEDEEDEYDEYDEEESDEEDDDDYDRCGCSDPCCPCDGSKRGTP